MCEELEIILELNRYTTMEIWKSIEAFFKENNIDIKFFNKGKRAIENEIKKRNVLNIKSDTLKINAGQNRHIGVSQIFFEYSITVNESDEGTVNFTPPCTLESFIEFFLKEEYKIRFAYTRNIAYNFWQNIKTIESYERNGKDTSKLKYKKSDTFPEELIVDISNNPGRRIIDIQTGYIEAIGSTMYLGEDFFKIGTKKENLYELDFLEITQINDETIKIKCKDIDCFVDESTADIQNKLRETLYYKDKQDGLPITYREKK